MIAPLVIPASPRFVSGRYFWTAEADAFLTKARTDRAWSLARIAGALNVSESAVSRRAAHLNLPLVRKPGRRRMTWTAKDIERGATLAAEGKTWREIAEALGRDTHSTRTRLHKLGIRANVTGVYFRPRWTPKVLELIRARLAQGITQRELAARLGVSPSSLHDALYRDRLSARRKRASLKNARGAARATEAATAASPEAASAATPPASALAEAGAFSGATA